jgi:hypothetical protein
MSLENKPQRDLLFFGISIIQPVTKINLSRSRPQT